MVCNFKDFAIFKRDLMPFKIEIAVQYGKFEAGEEYDYFFSLLSPSVITNEKGEYNDLLENPQ